MHITPRILTKISLNVNYLLDFCTQERVGRNSDIDICVIMGTSDKRQSVRDILVEVECEPDLDVVACTPEEWNYSEN